MMDRVSEQASDPQRRAHWNDVFASKTADQMSWHEETPTTSLRLIRDSVASGSVVDVGAGESRLADELVTAGYGVTVLDISEEALAVVRSRLGSVHGVDYVVDDILSWSPRRTYDGWHDRAVFHFLVAEAEQRAYARIASQAISPGGAIILGTFAPDGPTSCSGLPTARHDEASLARIFAHGFTLEHAEREEHPTPWGITQPFTWVVLRRSGSSD